jgi:hypothetical protein
LIIFVLKSFYKKLFWYYNHLKIPAKKFSIDASWLDYGVLLDGILEGIGEFIGEFIGGIFEG